MEWTTAPTGILVALVSWWFRSAMSEHWKNLVDALGNGFIPVAACVLYVAFRVVAAPYFVWLDSCKKRDAHIEEEKTRAQMLQSKLDEIPSISGGWVSRDYPSETFYVTFRQSGGAVESEEWSLKGTFCDHKYNGEYLPEAKVFKGATLRQLRSSTVESVLKSYMILLQPGLMLGIVYETSGAGIDKNFKELRWWNREPSQLTPPAQSTPDTEASPPEPTS